MGDMGRSSGAMVRSETRAQMVRVAVEKRFTDSA
jgi:hypothetical protein